MEESPANASLERRTTALGEAPLIGLMVRLSLPGMIGMLLMSVYNIIDGFWVARLPDGRQAVGALTVVFPLQMIFGSVGMGLNTGVSSLVARRLGEGRRDEANAIAGHSLVLPWLLGGALAACCWLVRVPLLRAFGAPDDVMVPALAYLGFILVAQPIKLTMMSVDGCYRGTGNLWVPMFVMGSSAVINLILDPLLIFGLGPFPAWGVKGAAVATALSVTVGMAVCVGYLQSRHSGFEVRARHLSLRWTILRDIAEVGAPATVMSLTRSGVMVLFNHVLAGYSTTALAAYGLTQRVAGLAMPIVGGVSFGLLPVVGYNFGARNLRRMWQAAGLAVVTTAWLGGLIAVALWLLAPWLADAFTRGQDPELARQTVVALRIVLVSLPLMAPQMSVVSALQGMGLGSTAMFLSLCQQVVFLIPMIPLLSAYYGAAGAYAAVPVADTLGAVLAGYICARVYHVWRPEPAAETPTTD